MTYIPQVDGRCDMGAGVIGKFGYAALNDSQSMLFDGQGFVAGRRPGDREDIYVFGYGHQFKECIKAYYALSGSQPLIPRWALGNWWSRYHRYSADEYIDLMDEFRKKDIPLSVAVIDMDWHLVDDDRVTHSGWGGYTWNDQLFPDPASFGRELHNRGLRITLNDHPHTGIHAFETSYKEMAKFLNHDTSQNLPILFDPTSPKFMEAFLTILHRNLEKDGCDFWWIDWQQGSFSKIPGLDPLWLLNHFHFLDNALQHPTPLIFSRYAGPGSHRYPVGFSGDTVTTWASLKFQPEFTATASNIGYGWWSHDIGGHMGGTRDDELVTRWVQFGVFSPIMRLHSTMSKWASKEPWNFRPEANRTMSHFLQLRHRLIPYLYTRNVVAATKDEPLVQPMYWAFPSRDEAYSVPNQYFFGFELIIAPITEPRVPATNLACVSAWLPPLHRHVDIFTGTVYDGDRELKLYRPLETIPVFAHEGSIIPLDGAAAPPNGGVNPTTFEILVVVGRNGSCSVLEDPVDDGPGTKKAAPDSNERGSLIQYHQESGKLTAHVTGRAWTFKFLALATKATDIKVLVDGKPFSDTIITHAAYPSVPSTSIAIPAVNSRKYEIVIELGAKPELAVLDHTQRISDLLLDYQVAFDVKDRIWEVVKDEKRGVASKLASLLSFGLGDELIGPVVELLVADGRVK
jgi:alpha-glucosidase (family GH31 glycosyl hydrolase)